MPRKNNVAVYRHPTGNMYGVFRAGGTITWFYTKGELEDLKEVLEEVIKDIEKKSPKGMYTCEPGSCPCNPKKP